MTHENAQPAVPLDHLEGGGLFLTRKSVIGLSLGLLGGLVAASFTAGMFASGLEQGQETQTKAVQALTTAVEGMRGDLVGIDRRVLMIEASRFSMADAKTLQDEVLRMQGELGRVQNDTGKLEARIEVLRSEFGNYRSELNQQLADLAARSVRDSQRDGD